MALRATTCRVCLPGGRDPEQPSGLCAEAERPNGRYCLSSTASASRAEKRTHLAFSFLSVATCASRQTLCGEHTTDCLMVKLKIKKLFAEDAEDAEDVTSGGSEMFAIFDLFVKK